MSVVRERADVAINLVRLEDLLNRLGIGGVPKNAYNLRFTPEMPNKNIVLFFNYLDVDSGEAKVGSVVINKIQ